MTVGMGTALAAVFLAGGILFIRFGAKTGKKEWIWTGAALLLLCAAGVLYLLSALVLLYQIAFKIILKII